MESLSKIFSEMLTTKDVAVRLGVSVAKVHRLIVAGAIQPEFKLDGVTGRYYFNADEVDRVLAELEATEKAS